MFWEFSRLPGPDSEANLSQKLFCRGSSFSLDPRKRCAESYAKPRPWSCRGTAEVKGRVQRKLHYVGPEALDRQTKYCTEVHVVGQGTVGACKCAHTCSHCITSVCKSVQHTYHRFRGGSCNALHQPTDDAGFAVASIIVIGYFARPTTTK